jgi:hypothetical protein
MDAMGCAMDKRTEAAAESDNTDAADAGDGKLNDLNFRCGAGLPNSGKRNLFSMPGTAGVSSVGGGI